MKKKRYAGAAKVLLCTVLSFCSVSESGCMLAGLGAHLVRVKQGDDRTKLNVLICNNDVPGIRKLNPDWDTVVTVSDDTSPLLFALAREAFDAFRCLVQLHPNLMFHSFDGESLLGTTVAHGLFDAADYLCRHGFARLGPPDHRPLLHRMLALGNFEAVKFLVDHKCGLTETDHAGVSAYHAAAGLEDPRFLRLLLGTNAFPVGVVTPVGRTLLHWAASDGRVENVTMLVEEFGLDLEQPDLWGAKPLHLAAWDNQLACVHELFRLGADINSRGPHGNTALHFAAGNGRQADALFWHMKFQMGASHDLKNDQGWTATDVAAVSGNTELRYTAALILGIYVGKKYINGLKYIESVAATFDAASSAIRAALVKAGDAIWDNRFGFRGPLDRTGWVAGID